MTAAEPPALLLTLVGHAGTVNACAVGAVGSFLLSASGDGTLKEVLYALARTLDIDLDAHKARDRVRAKVLNALEQKGWDDLALPAIQPIIIEGPPIPLPWDELAHLQFDDQRIVRLPSESLWGRLRRIRWRRPRAKAPA